MDITFWGRPKLFHPLHNASVTFGDAGHILDSAWERLDLLEGRRTVRLCFSGDLGRLSSTVGLPAGSGGRP